MRILFTAHGFPPAQIGGTQLHALDLALGLMERGHRVEVLCPERAGAGEPVSWREENVRGVRVRRLILPGTEGLPMDQAFRRSYLNEAAEAGFREILSRSRPDIVHFHHLFDLSVSLAAAAKDMGLPAVLTLHDLWVLCEQPHFLLPDLSYCHAGPADPAACARCLSGRGPGIYPERALGELEGLFRARLETMRQAVESLSGVVCLAGFQAERLARHGLLPRKLWNVPLGLAPPTSLPERPGRKPGGDLRLACLGLVTPAKGTDLVVAALNLAGWEGFTLDVRGIVCDQSYLESMRAACPPGRVRFHGGYLPADLPSILAQADVLVMPSRSENTPLVVLESLALGVPVVGSDVGGIPEMLGHGRWGLTFERGNACDLARLLARLRDEPGLARALGLAIPGQRKLAEEISGMEAVYLECARGV